MPRKTPADQDAAAGLSARLAPVSSPGAESQGEVLQMKELAASGKLRVGVVAAPSMSAFFVTQDGAGEPHGVTVDLGAALAERLGVPVEFVVAPNSGLVTDALAAGEIDVSFMPVDDERKARIAFGPAYFVVESTFLVTAASGIATLAEVDRPGVRVVGIANTTTIRSAARTLKRTTVTPAASVDEAMAMMRLGSADAFALSHDSLPPLAARLPGSRILDGAFQRTVIAVAVPKNRPQALAAVTAFMEDAKASGVVRRALDAAGFRDAAVAPPAAP
jgi:polar amino acid transport system substrate-binding protein